MLPIVISRAFLKDMSSMQVHFVYAINFCKYQLFLFSCCPKDA
jgi:hypothetical protein